MEKRIRHTSPEAKARDEADGEQRRSGKLHHGGADQDHAEQSHDVDLNLFPPMERAIGMWNCRHFTFSIIIGVYPRNYSQEELDKILRENAKGHTYNKKHYTMYQLTQLQRQYELEIRRAKDGWIAAKRLGDDKLMEDYENKVNQTMNEYQVFNADTGLSFKYQNIYVAGYK